MSKNMVEPERPQITIWRRVAFRIIKDTRTQTHVRALTLTLPTPEKHTHVLMHTTCTRFSTATVVS